MNNKHNTYYFVFSKNHKLYGYWVEVIGTYSQNEASQVFSQRYGYSNYPKDPSVLKFHTKGCYEQIYLPLPDNIKIDSDDPFFSEPKQREDFIWAVIGANRTGKSSMPWSQMMGRANKSNPFLILDDYRSLLSSKKINIHQKINMNAAKAIMKKYTNNKDKNSEDKS